MNVWETVALPKDVQAFALLTAISGLVVSGVALAVGRLFRRRSAPFRYGVLFSGVIALLAAPLLVGVGRSLNGLFAITTEETVRIPADQVAHVFAGPGTRDPAAPLQSSSSAGDLLGTALIVLWALGLVLGSARLVRGLWKQRRALVGEPWRPEWWTDERRRALAEKVGLRSFPLVWRTPCAPLPMVVGLWRPRIVLPESAPNSWGQGQWEAVLLHEAAHIARRDPWAVAAQRLAVILFWWCPLVHLLSRRLNELRETICDDYALEGPCDRLAYAELLVETAERLVNPQTIPVPVGLLDPGPGGLEERITRLLAKEKRPMSKLTLAGKLLGATVLALAGLTITAATAYTQAPSPQKKVQIKIIVDGKEIDLSDEVIRALLARKQPQPARPAADMAKKPDRVIITRDPKTGAVLKFLQPADKVIRVPDPRVEELVKQAEKIKPGSGDAVRKAVQGAARNVFYVRPDVQPVLDIVTNVPAPSVGKVPAKAAKAPSAAELDALRDQLLRLSKEVEALRARLDGEEKKKK
jgi:beta-lactamase regulating signal transducer with metallopeptidase domain